MGEFTTTGKILILLSLLVFLGGVFSLFWEFPWENKTPFIEKGRPVKPYNEFIVRGPIHVTHRLQNHPSLFLSGRREHLDSTSIVEAESTLTIEKPMTTPHAPGRVFAELKGMPKRITVSRGAHIHTSSDSIVDSMVFNVNNLSTVTINAHIQNLMAKIRGRGHIHLSDTVDTMVLDVYEHGRFSVEGGHIGLLKVNHESDDEVYIESADRVEGLLSGNGNIRLHSSDIETDIQINGSGKVLREGEK